MPPKLIVFHNPDKTFHEKVDLKNLGNLPHPFRMIMAATPNCGKTSLIKNIILNQSPEFDRIIVWHIDVNSKEYTDCDVEMVSELPQLEDLCDTTMKTLLIIEDQDTKSMHRDIKSRLDRVYGYCSTHGGLSVILTAQEAYKVPISLRRTANCLVLWRGVDNTSINDLGRRFGMTGTKLNNLFERHCHDTHDSIIIDQSGGPKLRKNLFEVLTMD